MRKAIDDVNHVDPEIHAIAAPAEAVVDLIHAVTHRFRSLQHQVLRDGPHGLTHMESKVLGFFSRHPDATQSDLAQHSGRDKAQLARLVKGLRERGFLLAEADAADRRNVHLRLSDEGQSVQRLLRREARTLGAHAVDGLSADQQALLVDLLGRVKTNLDRRALVRDDPS